METKHENAIVGLVPRAVALAISLVITYGITAAFATSADHVRAEFAQAAKLPSATHVSAASRVRLFIGAPPANVSRPRGGGFRQRTSAVDGSLERVQQKWISVLRKRACADKDYTPTRKYVRVSPMPRISI